VSSVSAWGAPFEFTQKNAGLGPAVQMSAGAEPPGHEAVGALRVEPPSQGIAARCEHGL